MAPTLNGSTKVRMVQQLTSTSFFRFFATLRMTGANTVLLSYFDQALPFPVLAVSIRTLICYNLLNCWVQKPVQGWRTEGVRTIVSATTRAIRRTHRHSHGGEPKQGHRLGSVCGACACGHGHLFHPLDAL
jgi:hypothetical protein